MIPELHFWPAPLQAFAYFTNPMLRLQHFPPLEKNVNVLIDTSNLFPQCNCFHLDPWPSIVDFYGRTLPQINLSIPKFPTLFRKVQGGLMKNP